MILETLQFSKDKGWSQSNFPDLDSENTLIFIFSAPEYIQNPAPITEIAKKYPKSKIIGCSSAGEISGGLVMDHSLSVAIIKFEKTTIKKTVIEITDMKDSYKAGEVIASRLAGEDLRGIFVLAEGLKLNGSELVSGLNIIKHEKITITGGLAGDGNQFKHTWVLSDGKIVTNSIVAVGFYGDFVRLGHGSKGGWDIFGPERHITRSTDNILYELDGKSALNLYKKYLGDKASELPASGLLFPLAIRKDTSDPKQLVRTILAVDEKKGSLTFAGNMPIGYLAQLMRANFDRLITGAKEAGELILKNQKVYKKNSSPLLLIAVSCVGRRLLLGERTEEETDSVWKLFPEGTQQVGFYSYGEISPYATGDCDLHNQTMTLTSISEEI